MADMATKDPGLGSHSINDEFTEAITYNSVAAVTKQCDMQMIQEDRSAIVAKYAGISNGPVKYSSRKFSNGNKYSIKERDNSKKIYI